MDREREGKKREGEREEWQTDTWGREVDKWDRFVQQSPRPAFPQLQWTVEQHKSNTTTMAVGQVHFRAFNYDALKGGGKKLKLGQWMAEVEQRESWAAADSSAEKLS